MSRHANGRIRVLVVEDSAVMRALLVRVFSGDAELEVVGTAADGVEAIEQARRLRPDVITMDIHLPKTDGLEATRVIMETVPTPIVVVSASSARNEVADSFQILEAGAVTMADKPKGLHSEEVRKLIETVKLMAEVKVVRRWPRAKKAGERSVAASVAATVAAPARGIQLVAVGASTGGPLVLKMLLAGLPTDFPVPVLIVQHISPGFAEGFAQWLGQASGFPTATATHGQCLVAGCAYVAPDGRHMGVERNGLGGARVTLNDEPPENGHRPAVSQLLRSAARSFGSAALGVLLTGMGRDGAAELKQLRDLGAVTIVQSPESAVVAGMPGEAIELGAALHVAPPEWIPGLLTKLLRGTAARSARE